MDDFYFRTLTQLLEKRLMTRNMHILVVCGGRSDHDALHKAGFKHVTISNLDVRMRGDEFAPFAWIFQDAEDLKYSDGTFDFCIVHNGLHHCYSPHRALLEIYRVARKGILVFEPRDTFLVRLGVKLNFGQEYEVAAVAGNALKFGGVRNCSIPNYVYRWSEREIEKTIRSFTPIGRPRFHYFYALRVPTERLSAMKNRVVAHIIRILLPLIRVFTHLFPKQCNCFAFAIEKLDVTGDLHPWLALVDGQPTICKDWVQKQYGEFK